MQAILIDSNNRVIKAIEIGNDIKEIQKLVGGYFTIGGYLDNNDCIYVSDDIQLDRNTVFFEIGQLEPLAGIGLVVGTDSNGNTVDCSSTVQDIDSDVLFFDMIHLILQGKVS